jgi:curved DNA-binding protein CbpA
MSGIFSRLRGGGKLNLAQKHQLVMEAVDMHAALRPSHEIEEELHRRGASVELAKELNLQALQKYEDRLVQDVALPQSAKGSINYYFLLGVTPYAAVEAIRRAYRRKAKVVHPDAHQREFTEQAWSRLMTTVGDAHQVLTDPITRRAYDVIWRRKSKAVAAENRKRGEVRGDWETRFRWHIAELAEMEQEVEDILGGLHKASDTELVDLMSRLGELFERYEGELLEVRNESYALGSRFEQIAEQVRHETQRKQRLVKDFEQVKAWLPEAQTPAGANALAPMLSGLEESLAAVRAGQERFDLTVAR